MHAAYKCYVFVREEKLKSGWNRDKIIKEILKNNVSCYSGSCSEIYREKAFDNTQFRPKQRLKVSRDLGEKSLMFLVHPNLTKKELDHACNTITKVMKIASKKDSSI